jgi:hypothetical protein
VGKNDPTGAQRARDRDRGKREFAKAFLPAFSYAGRRCRSIRCIIET